MKSLSGPNLAFAGHGLTEGQKQILFNLLAHAFLGVSVKVLLFGSRRRGDHRSGSDVDLAFESRDDIRHPLARLREALDESILPFFFDLVDLKTADPDIVFHIRREGIILWMQ